MTEGKLQLFSYDGAKVRVIEIGGDPWFVANDICNYFKLVNPRNATSRLDEDEKGVRLLDTPGGKQQMTIVNESGLYHLIFSIYPNQARGIDKSEVEERKKSLVKFRRWVFHEVLPSIRKHGLYAVDEVLQDPEMLIKALRELQAERAKTKALEAETKEQSITIAMQGQQIAEMNPKASYFDLVLKSKALIPITAIAKDYGKAGSWLNQYLNNKKVQYKLNNQWILYQNYADQGYTQSETVQTIDKKGNTHTFLHTKWTQKGRMFIYDLLKKDGILPECERISNEEK